MSRLAQEPKLLIDTACGLALANATRRPRLALVGLTQPQLACDMFQT
jgi:hypothetical protein